MTKESELTATEVRVISHSGANKQPSGGYATFSDGKYLGFGLDHRSGEYTFTTYAGAKTRHGLRLPKRAKALVAALDDGRNVDASPIKIVL
jgi:hypothetical protein